MGYGNGGSYGDVESPTQGPTKAPTKTPTPATTSGCTSGCELDASITWKNLPPGTLIPIEPFKDTLVDVYAIARSGIIDVQQVSIVRRLSGRVRARIRRLTDSSTADVTMIYKLKAADRAQATAIQQVAQGLSTSAQDRTDFTSTLVTNAANLDSVNFDPVTLIAAEVSASYVDERRYEDDGGLSSGAVAGIVIGVLCGVVLLTAAAISMKKDDTTPQRHCPPPKKGGQMDMDKENGALGCADAQGP